VCVVVHPPAPPGALDPRWNATSGRVLAVW
jgi:hypothetical protein